LRLGVLAHWEDGLFGYFVDDDYTKFHAAPAALRYAREYGPNRGFLQGIKAVTAFYSSFAQDLTTGLEPLTPVTHPYIDDSGVIWVRPNKAVKLTLLLEPHTSVNAICGLLPRKDIGLRREWTNAGLARLAPTFRFGPLLVERKSIRMPISREINGTWTWSRRATTTDWSEDPVVNATGDGSVPEDPVVATEGWLTLDIVEDPGS
jgi:hypothetical protein